MHHSFVWNLNPTILQFGPFELRYYGIIFASMLVLGYLLWRWQMLRGGYSLDLADRFILWGVIAVIVGARLGHVLFYEPKEYFSHPLTIFEVWHGGLASHGATVGLLIALYFFARRNKLPLMEMLDRFSFSAAVGAALVRLGNFLNSEIVGRPTDLPWGVRFIRYDGGRVARHPSQIYEFLFGVFLLWMLWYVDKKSGSEKRPIGLLAGLFMTVYFFGRFMVEFVKEYQEETHSYLTMGQYLSILPFLLGIGMLVWSYRHAKQARASS